MCQGMRSLGGITFLEKAYSAFIMGAESTLSLKQQSNSVI
jgi:hypothetical protein